MPENRQSVTEVWLLQLFSMTSTKQELVYVLQDFENHTIFTSVLKNTAENWISH